MAEVTKLFSSKGRDGLTRSDRELTANYNRKDFLFKKFLDQRRSSAQLQIQHEHILNLGNTSLLKLESILKNASNVDQDQVLKNELSKIKIQAETFQSELKIEYEKRFEEEKKSMKSSYDTLMSRIERQRDEAEEERMKELVRKMNEQCELALERQWKDAEELRLRNLEEQRAIMYKQIHDEMEQYRLDSIRVALDEAEKKFLVRLELACQQTRKECEAEAREQILILSKSYDASIEILLQRLKEFEEKWLREKKLRIKFENDFRLLQADYKRFMNYTDHYSSDYMMKLRHIGQQVLEDKEFEEKLDEKIEIFNFKKNPSSPNNKSKTTNKKLTPLPLPPRQHQIQN